MQRDRGPGPIPLERRKKFIAINVDGRDQCEFVGTRNRVFTEHTTELEGAIPRK